MGPTADDLITVLDACTDELLGLSQLDWSASAAHTDRNCPETLQHLCLLPYSQQLATRSTEFRPLAVAMRHDAPTEELIWTLRTSMTVLAEVARAAPADARAFHPAGMADVSGWVAMAMDELVVHTSDIATGLDATFTPPVELVRPILDRLFPWWPRDVDPWLALLWSNGRIDLANRPRLGISWLWHCAPLSEWDGTVPHWDPAVQQPLG